MEGPATGTVPPKAAAAAGTVPVAGPAFQVHKSQTKPFKENDKINFNDDQVGQFVDGTK